MQRFLSILLFLFLSTLLWGTPTIEATVDRNQISANDDLVTLMVRITNDSDENAMPRLKALPADFPFRILRKGGPSQSIESSTQIINGKFRSTKTITTTFSFLLQPTKTPPITIPALSFECGNDTLTTRPIRIGVSTNANAGGAPAESKPFLRQSLSTKRAVIGVPVALTYEIWVPEAVNLRNAAPDLRLETLEKDFQVELPEEWSQGDTVQNGLRFALYTLTAKLTPKAPGNFTIPGALATLEVVVPRQPSQQRSGRIRDPFEDDDFFGSFFGGMGRNELKQKNIAGNPLTLTVEDFPKEGKPKNFSGLVGPLAIIASADLKNCYVGDPITLTLQIVGSTVSADTTFPDLKPLLEAGGKFRVSGDTPLTQDGNGRFLYTRTIRALSEEVKEIPSLKFIYYDPEKRTYAATVTNAIPLTIRKQQTLTLQQATGVTTLPTTTTASATQNTATPTRIAATDGIADDWPLEEIPKREWSPLPGRIDRGKGGLLWFILAPALLWLFAAGLRWKQRHGAMLTPEERAARGAKAQLKRALAKANTAEEVAYALQNFLCARYGQPAAFAFEELKKAFELEGRSAEEAEPFRELLDIAGAVRYASGNIDANALKKKILAATKTL